MSALVPVPGQVLVLYDGDCPWCRYWVAHALERGRNLVFAPLSGPTAKPFVGRHPPKDTLVVVERGPSGHAHAHTHFDAALVVARRLPWPWRALTWAEPLPGAVGNALYRIMAARRHGLPGRLCPLPSGDPRLLP